MRWGGGSDAAGKKVVENCGKKSISLSGCCISVVCSYVSSNMTRCEAVRNSLKESWVIGKVCKVGRFCWALTSQSWLWKGLMVLGWRNDVYPPAAQRQVRLVNATSCHPNTTPRRR